MTLFTVSSLRGAGWNPDHTVSFVQQYRKDNHNIHTCRENKKREREKRRKGGGGGEGERKTE